MIYKTQSQQVQPAMGGFFSWLGKAIGATATAIASVAVSPLSIFSIVNDLFDGDGTFQGFNFQRSQEIPLTSKDELMLDAWVENKFIPFFKPFFSTIKLYNSNPPTLMVFIEYYNNAQEFIALLNWYMIYIKTNGESGLTINAINARNKYIEVQIKVLETEIANYIKSVGLVLNPAEVSIKISKEKYQSLVFNIPNSFNIKAIQFISQSNNDQTIVNISNPNQIAQEPNKNLWLWVLFGIGAYSLLKERDE